MLHLCLHAALAEVEMPAWFGDNMVLQTNAEYGARSFLNGRAKPGEKVVVSISADGRQFPATSHADGTWEVQMNHVGQGGPTEITVKGEDGPAVVAHNVSGGDVIFCSGQSNMVFPLKLTLNATAEAATLKDYPHFRFFMTKLSYSPTPLWDLGPNGTCNSGDLCNRWHTAEQAMANGLIHDFSAVCYMTVRDAARVHTALRTDRAMALVQSAWGGTRVEAWMSTEAIATASRGVLSDPTQPPVLPPARNEQNNVSVLYNAMVVPFDKMAVRAALWYQGEANADQNVSAADWARGATQTSYYASYLQSMAADWRERKGMGDFAFLVVSLPPSVASGTDPAKQATTGRMEVRLAEMELQPHAGGLTDISGVAVTLDLGGSSAWGFDHPVNKNEISRRLALQLVHAAYAQQGVVGLDPQYKSLWTGPVLDSAAVATASEAVGADGVVLSFVDWSASGLALKDVKAVNGDGSRNDCTLCCAKAPPFEVLAAGAWSAVPLERMKWDQKRHQITLEGAGSAEAVRYAWSDYVECVLVNDDQLPLAPFVRNLTATARPTPAPRAAQAPMRRADKDPYPAARPPMGFNSWNYYHCNIDENTVKAVVEAIATNGMKEAGYEYVNIDDCWQVERNADGTIQPDPVRFPSGMKALADYAHSKGLKFGVYTARGSKTCQTRPGAYAHEAVDAATYCSWGLDYLKNDNCGGTNWPAENTSWIRFQQGFDLCYNQTGRYIVKSIEYCRTVGGCGEWIGGVANTWRTQGDVQATWSSVMGVIHANDRLAPIVNRKQGAANGQGNFNDADMLEVGNVGLTPTEQASHFSLWALAGSPLLAGTDVVHAPKATLDILANAEVTAINQDLGLDGKIQGVLVSSTLRADADAAAGWQAAESEVWCKPLADGKSVAVLMLNLDDDDARDITASFTTLGLQGAATVRDLWAHTTQPKKASSKITASVAPHGVQMFKLTTDAAVHANACIPAAQKMVEAPL